MLIDSKIEIGVDLGNKFVVEHIKNEPMLFNCDWNHAIRYGRFLTHHFLTNLSPEFRFAPNLVLDSRVHMLMPKWYPCIPGYHHDDVPRDREDGQPDYFNPSYRSKHAMLIFGGGSATEFALGQAEFDDVPLGMKYYREWHPVVVEKLTSGELSKYVAEFGKIIYFDDRTWHQGTPAYENGWRFFIRASISGRKPSNEVRKQVQVYLENPMEGW